MEPLELSEIIRIAAFDQPLVQSQFYQVTAKEPFIYRSTVGTGNDFTGTVANNANSDWKSMTKLEPSSRTPTTIFQVRWGVQNGMLYRAKFPSAVERFGLDDAPATGYISNLESDYIDMNEEYEFWTQKGIVPQFIAYHNDGTNALSGQACSGLGTVYPRMKFKGFRYQLKELKQTLEKGYKNVILGGVRS